MSVVPHFNIRSTVYNLVAGKHQGIRPILMWLIAIMVWVSPCWAEEYTLNSGDVLRLAIFGEPGYPVDIVVDDRGRITVPLLGEIVARELTPAALGRKIQEGLHEKKLMVDPFVQLDVREYRPFFISGAVARPGSYPFKPGMTIRHALAIAGGFKAIDMGDTAPALRIADLRAERANLLIEEFRYRLRLERLQAEARDENFPSSFPDQPTEISRKLMMETVLAEQEQLEVRQLAFRGEIAHLKFSLERAKKDAEVLAAARNEREKAAAFQLRELESARALRQKGLMTSTNLLNAERAQSGYRVDLAEAEIQEARVLQEISNLEDNIRKKHEARRLELITEIEEAQLEIAKLQTNLRYLTDKLLFISYYGEHKNFDDLRGSLRIVVYRPRGQDIEEIEATETSEVTAGDVIDISILPSQQFYGADGINKNNATSKLLPDPAMGEVLR